MPARTELWLRVFLPTPGTGGDCPAHLRVRPVGTREKTGRESRTRSGRSGGGRTAVFPVERIEPIEQTHGTAMKTRIQMRLPGSAWRPGRILRAQATGS